MSFNPTPEVAVARDAAKKLGAHICVVIYVDFNNDSIGYASYGKNKSFCDDAHLIAEECYDAAIKWYEE